MSYQYENNGLRPNSLSWDMAVIRCMRGLLENPNLVIMWDIESGQPYLVTKEYQQSYIDFMDSLRPKENLKPTGLIVMFGTGGSIKKKNSFEDIFYNPDKWNTNNKNNE